MPGLLAVSSARGDAPRLVLDALRFLGPSDGYGLSTGSETYVSRSLDSLESPRAGSAAVGYGFSKVLRRDGYQPVQDGSHSVVVDGRFRPPPSIPEPYALSELIHGKPLKAFREAVSGLRGSYTAVLTDGRSILCYRDPTGSRPLYFAVDTDLAAFSTLKRPLKAMGLNPKPFPPGGVAKAKGGLIRFERVRRIRPSRPPSTFGEAVERVAETLLECFEECARDLSGVAVGFSGGLDSSLTAMLLDRLGLDMMLVSVGVRGSKVFEAAERGAELLGLPYTLVSMEEEEVLELLKPVTDAVEVDGLMDLSIALPLHRAAVESSRMGFRVMALGQGLDEMFGGYSRHVRTYRSKGLEGVAVELLNDLVRSPERNFARDFKACTSAGVELRLPAVDERLLSLSLSIPPDFKVSTDSGRKLVLRKAAEKLGLPAELARRLKKAIQYETGFYKVLSKALGKDAEPCRDRKGS